MSDSLEHMKNCVPHTTVEIPKPTGVIQDLYIKEVNYDYISYQSYVIVKNPYEHPVHVHEISYILETTNRKILVSSGTIGNAGTLKPNDQTTLGVEMKMSHDMLVTLVKEMSIVWDVEYELKINMTVHLQNVEDLKISLSKKGILKIPTISDFF